MNVNISRQGQGRKCRSGGNFGAGLPTPLVHGALCQCRRSFNGKIQTMPSANMSLVVCHSSLPRIRSFLGGIESPPMPSYSIWRNVPFSCLNNAGTRAYQGLFGATKVVKPTKHYYSPAVECDSITGNISFNHALGASVQRVAAPAFSSQSPYNSPSLQRGA